MQVPEKKHALNPESVLIFAPTGQDAPLLASVLKKNGIEPEIFSDVSALRCRLDSDTGALLLAEEALSSEMIVSLNSVLAKQEPWSDIPIIVMTSGGETTMSSLRVLKAFTPSGNVTLIERPFRPITLIANFHVALRARRRQYHMRELFLQQQEATRVRDEFISVASHELKTPLTSLKLQAQLHQRMIGKGQFDSTDRVKRLLDLTTQQVDRLARLVEDMVDVSRVHKGKLTMQKSETDLGTLTGEVVDRLAPMAQEVGSTIRFTKAEGIVGFWDRYRLEQVITNLLTNAIRYSPGTPIWVEISHDKKSAKLSVRDEGPGIAPPDQERIFNRFERAVTGTSISGMGLGLYICKQIIESHGGRISVSSRVGQGATFTIDLPLHALSVVADNTAEQTN
jgi:signal transduction histidine kinase